MDQKQFDEMMDRWLQQHSGNETAAAENLLWARNAGIIGGEDPKAFVSGEKAVGMLRRALEYFFRQMIDILQDG